LFNTKIKNLLRSPKNIVQNITFMLRMSDSLGKIREPIRVTNIVMLRSSHPWEGLFIHFLGFLNSLSSKYLWKFEIRQVLIKLRKSVITYMCICKFSTKTKISIQVSFLKKVNLS